MGNIARIVSKVKLKKPKGYDPKNEQWNLPFTIELKENFHIHWQDIRIEMMPKDFDDFAQAITCAHKKWIKDGKPKEFKEMKRYGWWPNEEGYGFYLDRYKEKNLKGELCHNFRIFPRTEHEKIYYDNVFQLELQMNGQYHVHYKNFRLEIGPKRLKKILDSINTGIELDYSLGFIFRLLKKIRVIINQAKIKFFPNKKK